MSSEHRTSEPTVATNKAIAPLEILTSILKNHGPAAYGIAVATFYGAGFLSLNAYLGTRGIYDFEIISPRIILAGSGFFFYLLCFYIFAGRAVILTPKWLDEDFKSLNRSGPRPSWSLIAYIYSFVHLTFFCCFSAAIFSSLAIAQTEATLFYALLFAAFLIFYTFDVTNLDVRFPAVTLALRLIFECLAIWAFFANPLKHSSVIVFGTYVLLVMYINLVLDHFKRYGYSSDRIGFTISHGLTVILAAAVAYGALFHGMVSNKLGGARPVPIEFVLSDQAKQAVAGTELEKVIATGKGDLVYQTEAFSYIVSGNQTVRFRTGDIVALRVKPEEAASTIRELEKAINIFLWRSPSYRTPKLTRLA